MKNRLIIKTIHIKFNDFINFSKIKKNNDDFNYATFDFSQISVKDLITHKTIDISFSEMIDEVKKSMNIDNDEIDQNVKNDEESVFLKSCNENLVRDFANIKINQSSEQLSRSTFIFQSIASNRFSKNIFKLNYVKFNDLNYKFQNRNDRKKMQSKK